MGFFFIFCTPPKPLITEKIFIKNKNVLKKMKGKLRKETLAKYTFQKTYTISVPVVSFD